ncbi:uncharacterized protein LOC119839105 [Zerene cesonia]|uniref:uncharacterized protein LOC119839105 n=1 Tax=Zerene cesonia TaxID=33412 RepID=UPI0018E596AA|nr:uncharacterized protein LOC119839105 [Zerene cesonia]
MSRMTAHKLQKHIAEETQLLAEEKWLIKTLNIIKKERNSLQIERLHLESLKMQAQGLQPKSSNVEAEPSTSVVNLMQNTKGINSGETLVFEEDAEFANNVACNEESLNLTVTNSVFDKINDDFIMEEDEDDDDDVIIDMNMLMNGQNM